MSKSEERVNVEAGTILVSEFVVSVDFRFRVHPLEEVHQLQHSVNLERCHRVLWLTENVETSDVADADAVGVVPFAMAADGLYVLAHLDGAVKAYHIVVAAVRSTRQREASLLVPALNVIQFEITPLLRRGTMNNDFCNLSHSL